MKLAHRFFSFCLTLARELSEENAYARHLHHTGNAHSTAEWQRFIDRRHRGKYRNAKCC